MQKTLFHRYAALEAEYKKISEEREAMREKLVAEMKKNGAEKMETEYGTFTRAVRTSWVYSPAIKKKEDAIKVAKKREQEKGIAEAQETEYLSYRTNDNE